MAVASVKGRWLRGPSREPRAGGEEAAPVSQPSRRRRFTEAPASELARRYALLERAAVFYALPEKPLRALARRMRNLEVRAGDVVVQEGDSSTAIFFIESGRCQLRLESSPRNRLAVALLSVGDFFGELSCLTDETAGETAVALDDCRLLVLDRTALYSVLSTHQEHLGDLLTLGRQRAAGHRSIATQLGAGRSAMPSRLTAIYSPKGGSGRTTLALNVAGALARTQPGEVVVLDLSLPFAQAALMANLVPVSSLARAAAAPAEMVEEILLSAALFHPASVMILPGCIRPEEADLVTADLVVQALEILRRHFRHVVVDLGVAMTEPMLAVFDQADHVLLVVPPELAAVKGASDAYAILTGVLGLARERITVVSNARTPRPTIGREALERRLGVPVAVAIGYDSDRPDRAILGGSLLALSDPGSEIARAARSIAESLDGGEAAGGGDEAPGLAPETSQGVRLI